MRADAGAVVALFLMAGLSGCFGDDEPPVAAFTVEVSDDGVTVLLDASTSQGSIDSYLWDFGDGTRGQGRTAEKTYDAADTAYYVSLLAVGTGGEKSVAFQEVPLGSGANAAPVAAIAPANRYAAPNGTVVLDSSPSSDPDNDSLTREWFFGPIPPRDPPEYRFATGPLAPGASASGRFDGPGVYLLRSSEYPWMRLRLHVMENATESAGDVTVRIENFGAASGPLVTVPAGANVTFLNGDPVEHNLSVVFVGAGAAAGSEPVLDLGTLELGRYQATLLLEDGKGGLAARSWGVRFSDDAPVLPDSEDTQANVVQQGEHLHYAFSGDVLFDADVEGNVTWSAAPVPEPVVELAIAVALTETLVVPPENATCGPEACSLSAHLPPGRYEWEVRWVSGIFESTTIRGHYVVYGDPEVGNAELAPEAHGRFGA